MSEEYYSNDGGMVSDSTLRKRKSSKTKLPNLKLSRVSRRVPHTEFGEVMGYLTMGMLFVFPLIAFLSMIFPKVVFSTIGIIALVIWGMSQRLSNTLIFVGICLVIELLGFLSIGLFMAILG